MRIFGMLSCFHIMQPTLFDNLPLQEPPNKVIVQHNALVNARFDLSTVEMRLFMAMLSRIGRDDNEFREMHIPLTEIVALSGRRPSAKDYQQVAGMCDQLVSRILHIERPMEGRRRRDRRSSPTPDFDKIPLMAYAKYRGEEGALRVRFNDEVMPYLLQLHQNFTKAQVVQLLKLKSPHSYRIYWLLKEYATFGVRVLGVEELKSILNLEGQYKQFPLFRLRVLDRAQKELSQTDLPFEYELLRDSKAVTQIKFLFKPLATLPEAIVSGPPSWQQVLQELGLAPASLATIVEMVEQATITVDYVQFVVRTQQAKWQAGKVKSLPGAIFTAITKQHLLPEYEAQRKTRPVATSRSARQREKLLAELDDARRSLQFVLQSDAYTEATRLPAESQVRQVIAQLESQLQQLAA